MAFRLEELCESSNKRDVVLFLKFFSLRINNLKSHGYIKLSESLEKCNIFNNGVYRKSIQNSRKQFEIYRTDSLHVSFYFWKLGTYRTYRTYHDLCESLKRTHLMNDLKVSICFPIMENNIGEIPSYFLFSTDPKHLDACTVTFFFIKRYTNEIFESKFCVYANLFEHQRRISSLFY